MNPFNVVKDFERAVAEYTGAPFVVAVNSCTNALFLTLMYQKLVVQLDEMSATKNAGVRSVVIPKRTYVSVPMQIMLAGYEVLFRDEDWSGIYQLAPLPIWDAARRFTSRMFFNNDMIGKERFMCTSHHWNKILGVQQGGCILHNSPRADAWFRRARFDGRTEGVSPAEDKFEHVGWHMYMSPEIAAEGCVRLSHLPKVNADLPMDDYPDLSTIELFK